MEKLEKKSAFRIECIELVEGTHDYTTTDFKVICTKEEAITTAKVLSTHFREGVVVTEFVGSFCNYRDETMESFAKLLSLVPGGNSTTTDNTRQLQKQAITAIRY